MDNHARQFGFTRDTSLVILEDNHRFVEFDDSNGPYYEIHSEDTAKKIEEEREKMWYNIITEWLAEADQQT